MLNVSRSGLAFVIGKNNNFCLFDEERIRGGLTNAIRSVNWLVTGLLTQAGLDDFFGFFRVNKEIGSVSATIDA